MDILCLNQEYVHHPNTPVTLKQKKLIFYIWFQCLSHISSALKSTF